MYITKIHIADNNISEIDFDLQESFIGDINSEEEFVEIEKGRGSAHAEPVGIDRLIKILQTLKVAGSTHVQIEDHCDHQGYDISGFEIRKSSPEEIAEYENLEFKKKESMERIAKLNKEISEIRKTL